MDSKIVTRIPVMVPCPGCGEPTPTSELRYSDYFEELVCPACVEEIGDTFGDMEEEMDPRGHA